MFKKNLKFSLNEIQFIMSLKILWSMAYTGCYAHISMTSKYVTVTMMSYWCISDVKEIHSAKVLKHIRLEFHKVPMVKCL